MGCSAARIGGAKVADDRDAVSDAVGQYWTQLGVQQWLVAQRRIGALGQLGKCQRALCQVLEDQRRRMARRDQCGHDRRRGVDPVTRTPCGAADQKILHAAALSEATVAARRRKPG